MSTTKFLFTKGRPPCADVYTTRRNSSTYLTLRYWDGSRWYSLDYGPSRGAKPFTWPKKSRTRPPKVARDYNMKMCLRNISPSLATCIEWGTAYNEYDTSEILSYMIDNKVIPKDWKSHYQHLMQKRDLRKASGTQPTEFELPPTLGRQLGFVKESTLTHPIPEVVSNMLYATVADTEDKVPFVAVYLAKV